MKIFRLLNGESSQEGGQTIQLSYFKNISDKEIWERFQNGDENALAFIYKEYVHPLFNFGLHQFKDRELIKDCIQDVFIELKIKRAKLSAVNSIKAYLYKCLYNKIREKLRQNKKLFLFGKKFPDNFEISIPVDQSIIDNELLFDRIKWLNEHIQLLNPKQRQAILLYYYEGLTHLEVSEVLGIKSSDGARMLIKRGLDKMKEKAKGNTILFSSAILILILLSLLN